MITERTHYFAKPGKRDEVLATRRRACEVRVAIGLQAGTIRVKAAPTFDGPDVSWQCDFADKAAHDAYQDHPRHKQFIAENQANWKTVRVFDRELARKRIQAAQPFDRHEERLVCRQSGFGQACHLVAKVPFELFDIAAVEAATPAQVSAPHRDLARHARRRTLPRRRQRDAGIRVAAGEDMVERHEFEEIGRAHV